jgi:hypothetical protein
MLHAQTLHAGRAFPQALLCISAMEDVRCDQDAGALLLNAASTAPFLGKRIRARRQTSSEKTGFSKP